MLRQWFFVWVVQPCCASPQEEKPGSQKAVHLEESNTNHLYTFLNSCFSQKALSTSVILQMTVHNLYLFDRNGVCLHYSEWHRKKQAGIPKEEEYKLMYGMLFSIRSFVSKMSPLDMKDGFLSFQTSRYKLHYYETPTGIKVVMNTDLGVGPIRDVLHHIYSALYVEFVVKNPLCPLGQTVQSELFRSRLDSYVRSLPFFSARAG